MRVEEINLGYFFEIQLILKQQIKLKLLISGRNLIKARYKR